MRRKKEDKEETEGRMRRQKVKMGRKQKEDEDKTEGR